MKFRIKIIENKTSGITSYVAQCKQGSFGEWKNINNNSFGDLILSYGTETHHTNEKHAISDIDEFKKFHKRDEIKITFKYVTHDN